MPQTIILCALTLILMGINAMYMSTQRWMSFPIPQMFKTWSDCTFNVHINSLNVWKMDY